MARKPSWVRTGQRALGGLLTSSAAEKEVGCPYGSPSRPLALVARGELGANRKLALLLLRSVRPKGGIPDQARRLALARFSECPFCYELQARVRVPACGGTATRSLRPRLCLGSLHLNPRPPISGLLPFRLFSRRGKRETRASVLERKIALLGAHFPSKTESKRGLEGRGGPGRTRPNPVCVG